VSSGDSDSSEDAKPVTSPGLNQADEKYEQLQELVEMIHEWRTINESPDVHERVAAANESPDNKDKVESLKSKNQEFDKITRLAMLKITRGQSVEIQLEAARDQLDELTDLAESLPET
jgi:hypothetical protein